MMAATALRHRDDIDGLRALAVVPVLLFHFGTGLVPGGFVGVDIFFVISGFVIARSIVDDIAADRFSIADFYRRRARRILPALTATCLAVAVAAWFLLLPPDFSAFGRSLASVALSASNIYFWKASGYFAAAAQSQPLLHTWSLGVEEQFYLVVPLCFVAVARWLGGRWLLLVVPVLVGSLACCIMAVFVAPTAGFFLLPTRAWELMAGALLAVTRDRIRPGPAARQALALGGLALVAWTMATLHEDDAFPGWNAIPPCLGTTLLIAAGIGTAPMPLVNRLLATRLPRFVGLISYSLYLVHWPIAALVRYRQLRPPTAAEAAAMLAASVLLAILSWRFVERPFRTPSAARPARVLGAAAAVLAAGAALGIGIAAAGGVPGRFPDFAMREIAAQGEWGDARCFNENPARQTRWNPLACTRSHGRHGRILLWGDSFAAHYVPGILRDARRIDADVLQYSFAGCPPILAYRSFARTGCAPTNAAVPGIVRAQRIDTVVLAARWTDTPRRTLGRLHETVSTLRALGVRVIVLGQSPQFAADVQQIDYISGQRRLAGDADWRASFDPAINQVVAAQARDATFIDPMTKLCGAVTCPYRHANDWYYADYGHFTAAGSLRAVQAYFPGGINIVR